MLAMLSSSLVVIAPFPARSSRDSAPQPPGEPTGGHQQQRQQGRRPPGRDPSAARTTAAAKNSTERPEVTSWTRPEATIDSMASTSGGEPRHEVAEAVAGEEVGAQPLQVREGVVTQPEQKPLGRPAGQQRPGEHCGGAHHSRDHPPARRPPERGQARVGEPVDDVADIHNRRGVRRGGHHHERRGGARMARSGLVSGQKRARSRCMSWRAARAAPAIEVGPSGVVGAGVGVVGLVGGSAVGGAVGAGLVGAGLRGWRCRGWAACPNSPGLAGDVSGVVAVRNRTGPCP